MASLSDCTSWKELHILETHTTFVTMMTMKQHIINLRNQIHPVSTNFKPVCFKTFNTLPFTNLPTIQQMQCRQILSNLKQFGLNLTEVKPLGSLIKFELHKVQLKGFLRLGLEWHSLLLLYICKLTKHKTL